MKQGNALEEGSFPAHKTLVPVVGSPFMPENMHLCMNDKKICSETASWVVVIVMKENIIT